MALPLTLIVFLASGFAALLYQVIWQRLLAIFSGADVYSATVIVAAFMAGLGIGHMAGGHVADRVSRRTCLLLFAGAEAAVAAFGLLSAALYYGVLYQRLGDLDLGRGSMAVVLFASLLWPTFFMGASLPLLARAVTERIERAAATIGALYGFNTIGAAAGAVVATWVLLPRVGLEGSLRIGAALNIACALILLPLAWRFGRSTTISSHVGRALSGSPREPDRVRATSSEPVADDRFWFWSLMYGVAGFIALSYEIVWFRLLGVMVKSTAFTFGTLLALYLTGIGLGAVAGSALARRVRRPGVAFFVLQASAGLIAAVTLTIFVAVIDDVRALSSYFGEYEPLNVRESIQALRDLNVPANFVRLYVVVPLLLIVPPTFLMGCAFPVLQRVVQTDMNRVGRRVGTLLLANIAGSMLGTVATGWLALTLLGTAGTLQVLAAMSGVFLLFVPVSSRGPAWLARLGVLGGVAALVISMPTASELWAPVHGTTADRMVFAEDNTGLSVITADGARFEGRKTVYVNGLGQSVLPYGDIHTVLGALPALVHPAPRHVAIIGLGSGDTVYAAAGRPETARVTCIEIIASQLETLRALARRDSYGGLHALLTDPRIAHVVGDGRAYLMRSTMTFDVIEADALRPTSAYSGNLYSEAYFTLAKRRLAPGGLAATWAPTRRIHDTFVKVFPYVISLPGLMLGSSDPIAFDRTAIEARLAQPAVRDYYARAGVDIAALVAPYIERPPVQFGPGFDRAGLVDLNTDLFPKDEYDLSPP